MLSARIGSGGGGGGLANLGNARILRAFGTATPPLQKLITLQCATSDKAIAQGTDFHASLSNIHVSSTRTPESGALYVAMHLCSGPAPVAAPIC